MMRNCINLISRATILFTLLVSLGTFVAIPGIAFAGSSKVDVCHMPPGNPDNSHTMTISENAFSAHLAHGDLPGACDESEPENLLCSHQYVLCIAASCDCDDSGTCECGLPGSCDQFGVDHGLCGVCYVFSPGDSLYDQGSSIQYVDNGDLKTCDEIAPTVETSGHRHTEEVVYSTFSGILLEDYGFVPQYLDGRDGGVGCLPPQPVIVANCMGAVCSLNPSSENIWLLNTKTGYTNDLQTATCHCKQVPYENPTDAGFYLSLPGVKPNCEVDWSTSGP